MHTTATKPTEKNLNRRDLMKYIGAGLLCSTVGELILARHAQAAPVYEIWVHGYSVQIQHPDITSIVREGPLTRVRGNPGTRNVFYFAIPAPAIINGNRTRVTTVMVHGKTADASAIVRRVDAYDGATRIMSDEREIILNRLEHFGVRDSPQVNFGIGIAIEVEFHNTPGTPEIAFISAGCALY